MQLFNLALIGVVTAFFIMGTMFEPFTYSFANFTITRSLVFSFVPSLVFSFINITYVTSDTYHRMMQPICGLNRPDEATENILIDYISTDPISTLVQSVYNEHWRIAWGSVTVLLCSISTITAGSIFSFDKDAQTASASRGHIIAILVYLSINVLMLPLAALAPQYDAGRVLWNIMDTISLCYDSPVVQCPWFKTQDHAEKEIHFKSRIICEKRKYGLGHYEGVSHRRRFGFDYLKDPSSGEADGGIDGGIDQAQARRGYLDSIVHYFARPWKSTRSPSPLQMDKDGEDHVESYFGKTSGIQLQEMNVNRRSPTKLQKRFTFSRSKVSAKG